LQKKEKTAKTNLKKFEIWTFKAVKTNNVSANLTTMLDDWPKITQNLVTKLKFKPCVDVKDKTIVKNFKKKLIKNTRSLNKGNMKIKA